MPRKPKVRAPYRMVGPATWELARAAYLGGETAQAVADRFGIGLQNLRQKIHREGWSKKALAAARDPAGPGGPAPAPGALSPPVAALASAPAEPEDLMTTVLRRAREALTAGRGSEATALLKAAREYVVVAQDVDRARQDLTPALLDGLSPAQTAQFADFMVGQSLGQQWAPVSAEDAFTRLRDHWNRMPPEDRATFPVVDRLIAEAEQRIRRRKDEERMYRM